MANPTDQQLKEYAGKLPDIYRDVLTSFPSMIVHRRVGDGLSFDRVVRFVIAQDGSRRPDDVDEAITNLEVKGFLDNTDGGSRLTPTPLGERLIGALTGQHALPASIPALPEPTWG